MKTKLSTKKKTLLYLLFTFLTALPSIEALTGMSLIAIKNNEKTLIIFDSVLSLIIIIVLSVFYKKIVKKKKQAIFKSLLLAIGMFLFSIILNLLFSRMSTPENQHYINKVRNVAPVLMALHTRLFSPIIEELLTRGIFMNLFF